MGQKEKLNELQGKLDDIFSGLDDYYSQSILDELIKRIDATINDFNKDFNSLIGKLKPTPVKRKSTIKKTSIIKRASSTKNASTAKTLK